MNLTNDEIFKETLARNRANSKSTTNQLPLGALSSGYKKPRNKSEMTEEERERQDKHNRLEDLKAGMTYKQEVDLW